MTDPNHIEVLHQVTCIAREYRDGILDDTLMVREMTAALSARASAGENLSLVVARMLTFENSEYVPNIMFDQLRVALKQFTAAPQPAQAGASGGGEEHPYRQLQKWWEDGEPIPTLTIPDWAIASAYRQAVSKIVGPYFRAPNALPWAADITVAADWAAQEWRKKHPDYALDPLALAEWLRIHHRCSEVKEWERLPPELLWIYESLQRLAKLESAAALALPAQGEGRDE